MLSRMVLSINSLVLPVFVIVGCNCNLASKPAQFFYDFHGRIVALLSEIFVNVVDGEIAGKSTESEAV